MTPPAQTVWALLGERFADVGQWTSGLVSSQMSGAPGVGAARSCTMPGGNEIREALLIWSPETMQFKYQAVAGIPSWLKKASNHWTVQPLGRETCAVSAVAKVALPWWLVPVSPLMWLSLRIMGARFLDEMEFYLANGNIHPRAAKQKLSQAAAGS